MDIQGDHYVFWRAREAQTLDAHVTVRGQFDPTPRDVDLFHVEFLGNPALKRRHGRPERPIQFPDVHLLAYMLRQPTPGPMGTVIVRNQFTDVDGQAWTLGGSQFLLIPARKAKEGQPKPDTPPPPVVDHYLCYEAKAEPVREPMSMHDQFGDNFIQELWPRFFGVPADKNGHGILHPELHLAIYELRPNRRLDPAVTVFTADQLRRHRLEMFESVWFGVPSLKEWKR